MTTHYDLKKQPIEKQKRTKQLSAIIMDKIAKEGAISFADYMNLALYHKPFGYYESPQFTIGKQGDFTTAPEISPLFAYAFARQCHEIFESLSTHNIMELGAGMGTFAVNCLQELERLNALPARYYIYEISDHLRNIQAQTLKHALPHLYDRICFINELPTQFSGIIIANEVLDALPVTLISKRHQTYYERKVTVIHNQLHFVEEPIHLPVTLNLPDHYQTEINLEVPHFIRALSACLQAGVILFADYGYGQTAYYHPARTQGTLTSFYQHQTIADPLLWPGLLDITAHVNFTQVIESADKAGLSLLGFTSQAAFLLANDLLTLAAREEEYRSEAEKVNLHHAIKVLTFPTEMGDRIKIMGLGKNISTALRGFNSHDRTHEL